MNIFWLYAAGLLLLALIFLAPPLLRRQQDIAAGDRRARNIAIARERLAELEAVRDKGEMDDETFEGASRELKLSLADDLAKQDQAAAGGRSFALMMVLGIAIPAFSVLTYFELGGQDYLDVQGPGEPRQAATQANPHAGTQQSVGSIEEIVEKLRARLVADPNHPDGWLLLGQTYARMGRYQEAAWAMEQLHQLVGDDPKVLVRWADALAMANNGNLAGKPAELVKRALKLDPNDSTALWLAGNAAEEAGNYAEAIEYWKKVREQMAGQPQFAQELTAMINGARKKMGLNLADFKDEMAQVAQSDSSAQPTAANATQNAEVPSIQVSVKLDPGLAEKANPGDLLFIYARAEQGPPMPLAAVRLTADALPTQVTLDDNAAMLPQMKISMFPRVKVGARISKSGQPVQQAGDLIAETQVLDVAPGQAADLVIDQIAK